RKIGAVTGRCSLRAAGYGSVITSIAIIAITAAAWRGLLWKGATPRKTPAFFSGDPHTTAGWYEGNRSVELIIDHVGTSIERNTWPFPGDRYDGKRGWCFALRDRRPFFSCGTGRESLRLDTPREFAGVSMTSGTW